MKKNVLTFLTRLLFILLIFSGFSPNILGQSLQLLKDFNEGSGDGLTASSIRSIHDDVLYFSANDGIANYLWKTDGTEEGTINISSNLGSIASIGLWTHLEDKIIFCAKENVPGNLGTELWMTDGTEAGLEMIKDIRPGSSGSVSSNVFSAVFNSEMFFVAHDGESHNLWKTDGTEDGTIKVSPNMNGEIEIWAQVNEKIIFSMVDHSPSLYGKELYVTDGTAQGTTMLLDINPGQASSIGQNDHYDVVNNILYFVATDGDGRHLWSTDGTEEGTYKIVPNLSNYTEIHHWSPINDKVIFSFYGENGGEMWISDGSIDGTGVLKDINEGYSAGVQEFHFSAIVDDVMYFIADDGEGENLWKTDGTEDGTVKIGPDDGDISFIRHWTPIGDKIVFATSSTNATVDYGTELWVTDGTVGGTSLLKDINSGSGNGIIYSYFSSKINNTMFFTAFDGSGFNLWKTDGTEMGTIKLTPYMEFDIGLWTVIGNKATFSLMNSSEEYGREMWVTDGTETGTFMLKDINPGLYNGVTEIQFHEEYGNIVYFLGKEGGLYQFWRTDGTESGTFVIEGPHLQPIGVYMESINDKIILIFEDYNPTEYGMEMWVMDDVTAGIQDHNVIQSSIVYPNPNNGKFMISTQNKLDNFDVDIFDVTGKQVEHTVQYLNDQILVDFVGERGIYLAVVSNENSVSTHKIIRD